MWKAIGCFVGAFFSIAPFCGQNLFTYGPYAYSYGRNGLEGSLAAAFCLVGFILIFVGIGFLFLKEIRRARCPACGCSDFSRQKMSAEINRPQL